MTDRDALHKAILANPFDDTPRLVYADCLDEHGEHDRAEFIRVGCELARLESLPPIHNVYAGPHRGLGDGRIGFECEKRNTQSFNERELVGQTVAVCVPRGGGAVLFLQVDGVSQCSPGSSPIGYQEWTHYERYWLEGKLVQDNEKRWAWKERKHGHDLINRSADLLKAHERDWRGGGKCETCKGSEKSCDICEGSGQVEHPNGGVNHCPNSYDDEGRHVDGKCAERCDDCRGTGFACWPMVYEPSIVVGYSPPSNGEDSPFAIACTWSRGFISGMTSSWSTWTDHSDQILKSHPITDVTITSPKPKKILSNFIAVEGVSGYYHRLPGRSRWWSHWDLHIPGLAEVTEDLLLRAEWPHITFQFQPPEPH